VEIEVEDIAQVGAWPVKRTHLADHGEDGWERAVGVVERHVKQGAGVYYAVDGFELIMAWRMVRKGSPISAGM